MNYIDLHTHTRPVGRTNGEISFYNVLVGKEPFPEEEDGRLFSCGIHPWYIRTDMWEEQYDVFREWAEKESVRMIGEAGLDKDISTPLSLQAGVFEAQIRVSEQLEKPLLIHCVKAWDELIALRKKWKPVQPWIIHGFRKKGEQATQLLRQGFYLSFGEYVHEGALKQAWPDRLLLETDEATVSIGEIYWRVASMLGLPVGEVAEGIQKTVDRLGLLK